MKKILFAVLAVVATGATIVVVVKRALRLEVGVRRHRINTSGASDIS